MKIKIATEYTQTPGGRFKDEGEFSGEDFRDTLLAPKFQDAISHGEKLVVDLDGGYGYATSFLDEAFGGLARATKDQRVMDIELISDDESRLVEKNSRIHISVTFRMRNWVKLNYYQWKYYRFKYQGGEVFDK